ncbi:hypothetical protein P691DRAFT_779260 [Macrolepiota fuliginosa MF-IS2]|uniref:F-box domain-containing protein n=1 Tax=Macrolepiota fuliginosa MF-IS2 TaxID=1400762 RepID=A0A9P5X1D6_9AGAR|nr:hypothetical protein P691DRAFT_779260 [Macrolepiota fuliginosa MF-IS2]
MPKTSIDSLPREILPDIFLPLVGWDGNQQKTVDQVRNDLRLVSHLWDDIILSNPHLWTCIEIFVYGPPMSTIKLLLERSRQLPIELDLRFINEGIVMNERYAMKLLDVLWESSHRWKKITLYLEAETACLLTRYPFANAVLLESVNIDLTVQYQYDPEEVVPFIIQTFAKAPALRCLEYSPLNRPTAKFIINSELRLNTLTALHLTIPRYDCVGAALGVFHRCGSATWISLNTWGLPRLEALDDDSWSLHLPNLRILELRGAHMLGSFDCPNLQILSISPDTGCIDAEITPLVSLEAVSAYISTSKHSLQVLRLEAVTRRDLAKFFRNNDLVRIPVLEVKTSLDRHTSLEWVQEKVLGGMRERFGGCHEPIYAVDGARVTAIGWVDSRVLQSFGRYFSNTRTRALQPGLLPPYRPDDPRM